MEAAKDVSALLAFVVNSLKQVAVKEGKTDINKELLADVFQAKNEGFPCDRTEVQHRGNSCGSRRRYNISLLLSILRLHK